MAKIIDFGRRNLAWVLLLLLCIVFTFTNTSFLTIPNLLNILNQNTYIIICTYGVALIMMSGGLDMAVGYQMSICGVVCALMLNAGVPIALCVIVTIVLSVIFGLIGTFLEQMLKLPRIFVSIGLSTVYQGIAYVITNSKTISGLSDRFKVIGQGTIFHPNLTYAVIAMVIFGLIMSFIMDRTYFGRYVFALGGNESAARQAGVNALRVKYAKDVIMLFVMWIDAFQMKRRMVAANKRKEEKAA
jgi:ribose/xylose/arabinose/galactoside ABC-type transport system permease subunit